MASTQCQKHSSSPTMCVQFTHPMAFDKAPTWSWTQSKSCTNFRLTDMKCTRICTTNDAQWDEYNFSFFTATILPSISPKYTLLVAPSPSSVEKTITFPSLLNGLSQIQGTGCCLTSKLNFYLLVRPFLYKENITDTYD